MSVLDTILRLRDSQRWQHCIKYYSEWQSMSVLDTKLRLRDSQRRQHLIGRRDSHRWQHWILCRESVTDSSTRGSNNGLEMPETTRLADDASVYVAQAWSSRVRLTWCSGLLGFLYGRLRRARDCCKSVHVESTGARCAHCRLLKEGVSAKGVKNKQKRIFNIPNSKVITCKAG